MTTDQISNGVILLGCGRLGSSILEGWLKTGAVAPADLIILTPSAKPASQVAAERGARINPPLNEIGQARTLVIAVKPAKWREALTPLIDHLHPETILISVMAGVLARDIEQLSGRRVARVMPTTAVAQASGVAAVWSNAPAGVTRAKALFDPLADVVELDAEARMNAATAVAGSAPAFVYAFTQALARAGQAQGLELDAAARLAAGALRSAGAGAATGASLEDLVARIASPGGTTQAGLDAMAESGDLDRAAEAAVKAAVSRAGELSA